MLSKKMRSAPHTRQTRFSYKTYFRNLHSEKLADRSRRSSNRSAQITPPIVNDIPQQTTVETHPPLSTPIRKRLLFFTPKYVHPVSAILSFLDSMNKRRADRRAGKRADRKQQIEKMALQPKTIIPAPPSTQSPDPLLPNSPSQPEIPQSDRPDDLPTRLPKSQQDAIPVPCDQRPVPFSTEEENPFPPITRRNFYKHPIFWARLLGYAIPFSFLLYVLYLNYLPFGYHKTFTIQVGSANDTKPSEFYLEPSKDLSDRMTAPDGTTYRELNGMATAVFKPNAVLKNANITVSVEGGEGISLIPPVIDFDPNSVKWDYDWDFTKGVPEGLTNVNNRAFAYEGGTYFDGTARVEMASSSDMFEEGPFTVYVEWMPTDSQANSQEIIGHYNWEIWQNSNSVSFQVGRMDGKEGNIYNIKYPVQSTFFNSKHYLLATYYLSPDNGYVQLIVDGIFVDHIFINKQRIWEAYGNNNLTFGWTSHNYGSSPYYKGTLYKVSIVDDLVTKFKKNITVKNIEDGINIPLVASQTSTFDQLNLHVDQ